MTENVNMAYKKATVILARGAKFALMTKSKQIAGFASQKNQKAARNVPMAVLGINVPNAKEVGSVLI